MADFHLGETTKKLTVFSVFARLSWPHGNDSPRCAAAPRCVLVATMHDVENRIHLIEGCPQAAGNCRLAAHSAFAQGRLCASQNIALSLVMIHCLGTFIQ
jgi:hypothetical protein